MTGIPFLPQHQLNGDLDTPHSPDSFLPGNPRIRLNNTIQLRKFLKKEHDLGDLEDLALRLWLMSKEDSGNISPLHRQVVKGRRIVITEDIRLHLVWHYDRIFIKPLPRYLTSHAFWTKYLITVPQNATHGAGFPSEEEIEEIEKMRKTALGYLPTYSYLIRYESDFHLAQGNRLIPQTITWEQFSLFLSGFQDGINDNDVAGRFHYGEIRLTRLNFYSKFILRKFSFQRVDSQYGSYSATFYAPLLFTFGTLSLLLSAMQVEMSVEQVDLGNQWFGFWVISRGASIACVLVVILLSLWLATLFLYKFSKEWMYALREHRKKKRKFESMV